VIFQEVALSKIRRVLTRANPAGSHKVKLLLGNTTDLQCSKEYLPVHYKAQNSSWMDKETFLDWFTSVFVSEVEQNIKKLGRPQKPNCILLYIIIE
jgi:hypothetical protein